MNGGPKPYRVRRLRYLEGWRWVVARWTPYGSRHGVYMAFTPASIDEPMGFGTWGEAMADVAERLARRAK